MTSFFLCSNIVNQSNTVSQLFLSCASKHILICSSLFFSVAREGRESSKQQSKPTVSVFSLNLPPVAVHKTKILHTLQAYRGLLCFSLSCTAIILSAVTSSPDSSLTSLIVFSLTEQFTSTQPPGSDHVPLFSLTNLFQLPQNQCGILLCKYLPLPESLRQTCHLKMPRFRSHFFRCADHTGRDNASRSNLSSSRSDIRNLLRNPQVHAQNSR